MILGDRHVGDRKDETHNVPLLGDVQVRNVVQDPLDELLELLLTEVILEGLQI